MKIIRLVFSWGCAVVCAVAIISFAVSLCVLAGGVLLAFKLCSFTKTAIALFGISPKQARLLLDWRRTELIKRRCRVITESCPCRLNNGDGILCACSSQSSRLIKLLREEGVSYWRIRWVA